MEMMSPGSSVMIDEMNASRRGIGKMSSRVDDACRRWPLTDPSTVSPSARVKSIPVAMQGPTGANGATDDLPEQMRVRRDKRQELETQLQTFQQTQKQQMDAIAKALGLKDDDTPPDPAGETPGATGIVLRARGVYCNVPLHCHHHHSRYCHL